LLIEGFHIYFYGISSQLSLIEFLLLA